MNIIEALKKNEDLAYVPDNQLQFLVDKGKVITLEAGNFLFEKGKPADHFHFILSGKLKIFLTQNEETREISLLLPGDITGLLPYSRMTHAQGYGQAVKTSEVLTLHREHFKEMIINYGELTEALVHHMASRIRTFTANRMQNEKLMSLGKLSAGLAHELNNPASAMVRSSDALVKHLKLLPETFKNIMNSKLEPEVVDEVNDWLFELLINPPAKITLMQRSQLEDEVSDLLENWGFDDPYTMAESLVEYNISVKALEELRRKSGEQGFSTTINWIINNLETEKMVEEINTSAKRISELITSIKDYSHMDRSHDRQSLNVNEGIESTITMMTHKAKTNKVELALDFDEQLPNIHGFPGELKQVWTNLIDNALDAMENNGGTLSIKTEWCEPLVKVYIGDTGTGIPENIRNQIFDPFFTTKKIGKGTGLGLDIVAKIIAQHRAQIEVESKPGSTEFEISFTVDAEK